MQRIFGFATKAVVMAVGLSAPVVALCADESIGQKSIRLTTEVNSVSSLALTIGQLAGLLMAGFGISSIMKDKDNPGQEMMKKGMLKCGGGVGLYLLPRVLGMGAATFFP